MNDKELADRIVALGVGRKTEWVRDVWRYSLGDSQDMPDIDFVRDWRIAGALLQKGESHFIEKLTRTTWAVRSDKPYGEGKTREWYENESLPRAIIEACVEALEPVLGSHEHG